MRCVKLSNGGFQRVHPRASGLRRRYPDFKLLEPCSGKAREKLHLQCQSQLHLHLHSHFSVACTFCLIQCQS